MSASRSLQKWAWCGSDANVETMPRKFIHTIRVKYADTDQMKVVYYGRYFEYFEAARNEMLRELGYPYTRLESEGVMLPVVSAHADYLSPARYDDEIVIESIISKLENIRITIGYEVFEKQTRKKLVEAYTVHAFVSVSGKLTRLPKALVESVESISIASAV
jgi:acyl-CoA thioester hydrolase